MKDLRADVSLMVLSLYLRQLNKYLVRQFCYFI